MSPIEISKSFPQKTYALLRNVLTHWDRDKMADISQAAFWISIKISLKFLLKGPINNIPALANADNGLAPTRRWLDYRRMARPQWVNRVSPPLGQVTFLPPQYYILTFFSKQVLLMFLLYHRYWLREKSWFYLKLTVTFCASAINNNGRHSAMIFKFMLFFIIQ